MSFIYQLAKGYSYSSKISMNIIRPIRRLDTGFHQLLLYFACAVIITAGFENFSDFSGKPNFIGPLLCFIIISTPVYL